MRHLSSRLAFAAACLLAATRPAVAQLASAAPVKAVGAPVGAGGPAMASAVRAERAPVLDGKAEGDLVWAAAPVIEGFKVYDPEEGKEPRQRTTVQVAYDHKNLYVLVRAFDTAPDSILGLMSRRDVGSPSDWVRVMVDSYHDKRTGYQFVVNPVGVKRDIYIFNDGEEDLSWDAVWHVETSVDDKGWTAEYAIPWAQLRYPTRERHSIGLMVIRRVERLAESQSWPLWRRNETGFVSQFGEVAGIDGLPSNRRAEIVPYVVQKGFNEPRASRPGYVHRGALSAGADLKLGVTSNVTLDATINPDFGQVEADPATYNLSTTENYFSERRPFFMEGMGIFRFDLNCNDGECTGLFYSRRIGAAPRLRGDFGDVSTPSQTTILGAGKLTGRTNSGLSVGLLNAVTQRELGFENAETGRPFVVEPTTNYVVGRAQQEFRGGNSVIGVMGTNVERALEDTTAAYLRRSAISGGVDFSHRFAGRRYQLNGYVAGSRVAGSREAIARTQRSFVHLFDRVDGGSAGLEFDSTRTSLRGLTSQLFLNRTAGLLRFSTGYTRTTPGFEINDAGFLGRADEQMYSNWAGLRFLKPRLFYRMVGLNFNQWTGWNTHGERLNLGGNINGHSQLKNNWFVYGGTGVGQLSSYNDRDARGGPAFRRSPSMNNWAGVETDQRKPVMLFLNMDHWRGDFGRSRYVGFSPGAQIRPSTRFSVMLSPRFSRNIDDSMWYDNFWVTTAVDGAGTRSDSAFRYVFAHLDQKTMSMTTRVDFAATPTLSLQVYASPFVTSGEYTNLRRLSEDPRSKDYATRFVTLLARQPDGSDAQPQGGGFNYKQFNSNTVLRWEYRPGSTLFFVWAQGRVQDGVDAGSFRMQRDARNLFRAHPSNTFIIKGSYWFSL